MAMTWPTSASGTLRQAPATSTRNRFRWNDVVVTLISGLLPTFLNSRRTRMTATCSIQTTRLASFHQDGIVLTCSPRKEYPVYEEEFLYDLEADPHERHNLVSSKEHVAVRQELAALLKRCMTEAGEQATEIKPV